MKKNFEKKSHNAEKTEREDPLGFFNIYSVAKLQKNLKGGPFGIFQHPFCCKTPKKVEGGAFVVKKVFLKKVAQCRKNGPFGLVRYCMLRGKPFWFSSLGQQVHFGVF